MVRRGSLTGLCLAAMPSANSDRFTLSSNDSARGSRAYLEHQPPSLYWARGRHGTKATTNKRLPTHDVLRVHREPSKLVSRTWTSYSKNVSRSSRRTQWPLRSSQRQHFQEMPSTSSLSSCCVGGHIFIEAGSSVRVALEAEQVDLGRLAKPTGHVHSSPIQARCRISNVRPTLAARTWIHILDEAGIAPRVFTKEEDTEAAIRWDDELVHVYALNHGPEPQRVVIQLKGGLSTYSWVELRSGKRARADAENLLTTPAPVGPCEAAVWATVRRPAEELQAFVRSESGERSLIITAKDEAGRPVADGYPIRIEWDGSQSCASTEDISATLSGGQFSIPISCNHSDDGLRWMVTDPLTGQRASSSRGSGDLCIASGELGHSEALS